jgi:hypothetical protein
VRSFGDDDGLVPGASLAHPFSKQSFTPSIPVNMGGVKAVPAVLRE